mmetsp:Transcript_27893/g.58100  ORF Transcript_27893/g.58100 Transcript_27893/m.58100 type:complete len:910 (-) Transcript_27893:253-2982(-)
MWQWKRSSVTAATITSKALLFFTLVTASITLASSLFPEDISRTAELLEDEEIDTFSFVSPPLRTKSEKAPYHDDDDNSSSKPAWSHEEFKLFPKSEKSSKSKPGKTTIAAKSHKDGSSSSNKSGKLFRSKSSKTSSKTAKHTPSPSTDIIHPPSTSSNQPTSEPSVKAITTMSPSKPPTVMPTPSPSSSPIANPTKSPSISPTYPPSIPSVTEEPTIPPSSSPVISTLPPTESPSNLPTTSPITAIRTKPPSASPTTATPTISTPITDSPTVTPPCACSPRSYTFKLILSQNCQRDDVRDNPGIEGTFCNIDDVQMFNGNGSGSDGGGEEETVDNVSGIVDLVENLEEVSRNNTGFFVFSSLLTNGGGSGDLPVGGSDEDVNAVDNDVYSDEAASEIESKTGIESGSEKDVNKDKDKNGKVAADGKVSKEEKKSSELTRRLVKRQDIPELPLPPFPDDDEVVEDVADEESDQGQQVDLIPTEIFSIVFIEFNPSLQIINTNGTYAITELSDGDTFTFPSISDLNPFLVPGGVAMLLMGVNGEGTMVRSRVAWSYGSNCDNGVKVLENGDGIGWVEVVDLTEPRPCDEAIISETDDENIRRQLKVKNRYTHGPNPLHLSTVEPHSRAKEDTTATSSKTGKSESTVRSGKSSKSSSVSKSGKLMKENVHKPSNLDNKRPQIVAPTVQPSLPAITPDGPQTTTGAPTTHPTAAGSSESNDSSNSDENLCSCTPTSYSFRISFQQNCSNNQTINENDAVDLSFCIVDNASIDIDFLKMSFFRKLQSESSGRVPVVVKRVVFAELDQSGGLESISKNTTYEIADLADGDIIQYTSISNSLDPDIPLSMQQNLIPGGVAMVLYGEDEQGQPVTNRVIWWYNNDLLCEQRSDPIQTGDEIGWINIVDFTPAKPEFC